MDGGKGEFGGGEKGELGGGEKGGGKGRTMEPPDRARTFPTVASPVVSL